MGISVQQSRLTFWRRVGLLRECDSSKGKVWLWPMPHSLLHELLPGTRGHRQNKDQQAVSQAPFFRAAEPQVAEPS